LPRIVEEILQSVVYLYPTRADAEAGEAAGGTGFFVAFTDSVNDDIAHMYVATAKHVITRGHSPVVRMNRGDDVDFIELDENAWIPHPDGDDVAVAPLGAVRRSGSPVVGVGMGPFITETEVGIWKLGRDGFGPGDECFFVGRFVNHEGRVKNTPSVRFGTLAMMNDEPIEVDGIRQESFLVEARSLSGYSGSPVFVYSSAKMTAEGEVSAWMSSNVRFLGIDWCHLHSYEQVLNSDRKTPLEPMRWVKQNTGMAGVIPAWKLAALLNEPEVQKMRDEERERLTNDEPGATLDTAEKDGTEYERFEDLTRKLVNTPKNPDGDES
jgi:hypothetical protein